MPQQGKTDKLGSKKSWSGNWVLQFLPISTVKKVIIIVAARAASTAELLSMRLERSGNR